MVSATDTLDEPLERLVRHVVAAMDPLEVWLFGSRAENRARPTSDYDLLVVMPDCTPDLELDPVRAWRIGWEARVTAAAELLLAGGNRYAAYHLQQAVEKVAKALLLARGIEAGIEHRLEELFKRFPGSVDTDEWPARLLPFVGYSAYATAFRYPTPGGRIPADPPEMRFDATSHRSAT